MGPFELMDLIGHDVNFAVTRSVYDAFFDDPRYKPSLIQKDLVDAGFLGRKSGRGFYAYGADSKPPPPLTEAAVDAPRRVTLGRSTPLTDALARRLQGKVLDSQSSATTSLSPCG